MALVSILKINGGWIAPKLYFLEYVEKSEEGEQLKYHLKGKGIPKEQLSLSMFESMMNGSSVTIGMERNFKRINVKRNLKQKEVDNFTIVKLDHLMKVINRAPWRGRYFIGNNSIPFHHEMTQTL